MLSTFSFIKITDGFHAPTRYFWLQVGIGFKLIENYIMTWNSKQPFFIGCFSWMIPNLYIKNSCFTKHPLKLVV